MLLGGCPPSATRSPSPHPSAGQAGTDSCAVCRPHAAAGGRAGQHSSAAGFCRHCCYHCSLLAPTVSSRQRHSSLPVPASTAAACSLLTTAHPACLPNLQLNIGRDRSTQLTAELLGRVVERMAIEPAHWRDCLLSMLAGVDEVGGHWGWQGHWSGCGGTGVQNTVHGGDGFIVDRPGL